MRKLLLILFAAILVSSCVTEKKVIDKIKVDPDKYCSFCPEKTTHTRDTIIEIDTVRISESDTTYMGSFIDLAVFNAMVRCDSLNRVQLDSLKFSSKKGSGFIYIKDNKLIGEFQSKHDSLIIITNKLTEKINIQTKIIDSLQIKRNIIVKEYKTPTYNWILLGILLTIIVSLLIRNFFKK